MSCTGRAGDRDFQRFLRISLGSANELEYYFLLARDLSMLKRNDFERLTQDVAEVRRILTGLIRTLGS